MWEFLLRQILRHELKKGAEKAIPDDPFGLMPEPTNEREAYVGRIKKDFHIDDYYDALELYNSDPAYWRQYYQPQASPDPARERIRDSAAAAGIPSRNNVWEYGYPNEAANPVTPQSPPNHSAPPTDKRSEGLDGVTPTGFVAADASNAPRSLFSQLLSAVPQFSASDATLPPLQPDAAPDAADNVPTRFLVGRPYDPSQGSPFAVRPAPSQASPDGSLSLNDAYLEYLKRLNADPA